MLHGCPVVNLMVHIRKAGSECPNVTHFNAVLTTCGNNLPAIELQAGNSMVVLDGFKHAA
jgi:hypothetical protein